MKYAQNVLELIGQTPLVKLEEASKNSTIVLGKCEFLNPAGSIKDRIGISMLESAQSNSLIGDETTIIEPTSGNTGIALAMACAVRGLRLIITMPENMSIERRQIMSALGADVILTDAKLGMQGAIDKAVELFEQIEDSYMPLQFANKANPQIHRETTAQEIWEDTKGRIDIFVAGVGTGGTITGVGEGLKRLNPDIDIVAVEPHESAVLSGEDVGSHSIQGIGAGFVPDLLDTEIYDEIIKVSSEDAKQTARNLACKEGLLVGISAGANVYAASQLASRVENRDKVIVTILPDTGDRYLSSDLFVDK